MKVLDFGLAKAFDPSRSTGPDPIAFANDHTCMRHTWGDPRHGGLHEP